MVAWRYFFSRKQKTVINIISCIALTGIAVSTAALIVVLSVYNGIGNLTQSLFNSFDPELLVQPAKGKTFHTSEIAFDSLRQMPSVAACSQIVEENAWVTYRHNQAIVALRGVDGEYPKVSGLDTLLYEGTYGLKAESDEATALRINAEAVKHLAAAMARVDGRLIHFSTDYVFGGNRNNTPCTELETVNPTGAYGRTKLAGEQAAAHCKSLVFRTSWLYSEYGKNFLLTMRRLTAEKPEVRVVFDQAGTPTYAGDLAKAVFRIVESGEYLEHEGIFNFANEGVCSWYDFAHAIAGQCGHTDCRVLPCHSDEYPSPVHRPAYSVLDKTKFKQTFHQDIPHWTDSLVCCLANIKSIEHDQVA